MNGELAGTASPGSGHATGQSVTGTGPIPKNVGTDRVVEANCREKLYKPGEQQGEPMPEPEPL